MTNKKDKLFYIAQKAFIEKDRRILILNDSIEGLDFPGGKVQEGETDFTQALKREVSEETSLEIEVGEPFFAWYHQFSSDHRYAGKEVYIVGFRCRYLSGEVKLSDEHDAYRWVSKNDYVKVKEDSDFFKALEKYFST